MISNHEHSSVSQEAVELLDVTRLDGKLVHCMRGDLARILLMNVERGD